MRIANLVAAAACLAFGPVNAHAQQANGLSQADMRRIDEAGATFVKAAPREGLMLPGAPGPIKDSGKYVEVRRRQPDGRWLLVVDMFSSDLPAAAPPK